MNEDKSVRYHRLKRRLSVASLAWSTTLLAVLLLTGASVGMRQVAALASASPTIVVLLYVVALAVVHEPVSLLLDFYGGYVLEHRYGLSRQSIGSWLLDHLKAGAVGFVLGLAAAAFVYWTMRNWPQWWWLVAGSGFSLVIILLANLAPVVLLPLFFKFDPLDRPALTERLQAMAARAGARIVGVYRWHLGEKTSKANAALTGLGSTRRILLADTMLDHYSDDEIEVVLAHELAHHVYRDIWSGIATETVLILVGFFAAHQVLVHAGPLVGIAAVADPAGLPLLLLAAGGVSLVLMPVMLAISRSHERRADRFALTLTQNPSAFVSAMKRLGAQNLAEERPSRTVEWLFYSHPPLPQRIEAALAWTPPADAARGL